MTIGLVHTQLNSLSYSAATAIIRYVYVRSSFQFNIQEVLKRNAFTLKAIFLVEFIGFINIYSLYMLRKEKSGVERLPFLLYQTCLDPSSRQTVTSIPVVHVILAQTADLCIICFNIYLYRYLNNQSRENTGMIYINQIKRLKMRIKYIEATNHVIAIWWLHISALSPADKLKARRRNLVSAKVGFYSFIFLLVYEPIIVLLHNLPLEVGKSL